MFDFDGLVGPIFAVLATVVTGTHMVNLDPEDGVRSTRHAFSGFTSTVVNNQWSWFMSQVAGDGVTEVSVQFLGVRIFSIVFSRKIPSCRKILGTCDSLDTLQFFFFFFFFSFFPSVLLTFCGCCS
jgi:hypothetical protein